MKVTKEASLEIDCDDVIEFISQASNSECQRIYDAAKEEADIDDDCDCDDPEELSWDLINANSEYLGLPKIETLADQLKLEFITSIWDKYTCEQLEERLK